MESKTVKKERLNLFIVPEFKQYIVDESARFGISQSAFVSMVVATYKQGMDLTYNLEKLKEEYEKQINP